MILDPSFKLQPIPTLDFIKFRITPNITEDRKIAGFIMESSENEGPKKNSLIAVIGFLGFKMNLNDEI